MDFSIIIANHNDDKMCDRLINNLLDTDLVGCDKQYEIIVIDDGSNIPYNNPVITKGNANIKLLRRNINLGVGDAFDWGVENAKGKYIFLMCSDVYCGRQGWIDQAIKSFDDFAYKGRSIMCFTCIGDNKDRSVLRYGAKIIWKMDGNDLSKDHGSHGDVTYRDIISGRWLHEYPKGGVNIVPCLMGSCYLTTKEFYTYIRGFKGHRVWGGLEPMISLKAWLAGGSILVNGEIDVYHTFTRHTRYPDMNSYYSNKIFISQTTLKNDQNRKLLKYFCNIAIRIEMLKLSYSYLYFHRDLINYLGEILRKDVRDIEILNWE